MRWIAALLVVAGCSQEISRKPTIMSATLEKEGALVHVADSVTIRHPCGAGYYIGGVLTLGMLFIADAIIANKLGPLCPSTDVTLERPMQLALAAGSSEPRRTINGHVRCMFATADEDCPTRQPAPKTPAWASPELHVYAVAPGSLAVIDKGLQGPCSIGWPGGGQVPLAPCNDAQFVDARTIVLHSGGDAHVFDITGQKLGDGEPTPLGAGLVLVQLGEHAEIVEREGWVVRARVRLRNTISDARSLVLVGDYATVEVPSLRRTEIAVSIDRVLDVRGDLMLCSLQRDDRAVEVAAIRISTGEVVARR